MFLQQGTTQCRVDPGGLAVFFSFSPCACRFKEAALSPEPSSSQLELASITLIPLILAWHWQGGMTKLGFREAWWKCNILDSRRRGQQAMQQRRYGIRTRWKVSNAHILYLYWLASSAKIKLISLNSKKKKQASRSIEFVKLSVFHIAGAIICRAIAWATWCMSILRFYNQDSNWQNCPQSSMCQALYSSMSALVLRQSLASWGSSPSTAGQVSGSTFYPLHLLLPKELHYQYHSGIVWWCWLQCANSLSVLSCSISIHFGLIHSDSLNIFEDMSNATPQTTKPYQAHCCASLSSGWIQAHLGSHGSLQSPGWEVIANQESKNR